MGWKERRVARSDVRDVRRVYRRLVRHQARPRGTRPPATLGKTILAAVAFFGSFLVLGFGGEEGASRLRAILVVAGILVALGLLFMLLPIFQVFANE
jgi:hypothetical protein